jgi:hypothetical protein
LETQRAVKRYEEISPSSLDSREFKLVKEIIHAMEENNIEYFTEAVQQHGQ